jgi:hypothetical protein
MASTSFRSDPVRIKKEMEMSTFQGRYQINVPGNGINLSFHEDPHIRLQGWGANLRTNTIGIENDLMGRTEKLSRNREIYKKNDYISKEISYKNENPYTEESRASMPAWTFRGIDQQYNRWESPWLNPQANLEKEFNDNIQTRLLEKSITETEQDYWYPEFNKM